MQSTQIHYFITLAVLLPYGLTAYPVFGTKRYGRSPNPVHNWPIHVPSYYYQPYPRTHYPLSYYDTVGPYPQDYAEDFFYPQETVNYPIYYPPPARSLKFDIYQTTYPYYYDERHVPHPYNYYDNMNPVDDLQEEMQQEEEREEREEALPIGQETWYENDVTPEAEDTIDDVNAAFLQNLMMYNEAVANQRYEYPSQDYYAEDWYPENQQIKTRQEDDDVKELKMLAEKPKKQKVNKQSKQAKERMQMFEKGKKTQKTKPTGDINDSEAWINWNNKRIPRPTDSMGFKTEEINRNPAMLREAMMLSARKMLVGTSTSTVPSTTVSITTEEAALNNRGGQKEVMMMRPATPVRRPFSEPVMALLQKQGAPERKRIPSVYDTIKHMLEMEKSFDEDYGRNPPRSQLRKRFVSNEESLVEELAGLKRTA